MKLFLTAWCAAPWAAIFLPIAILFSLLLVWHYRRVRAWLLTLAHKRHYASLVRSADPVRMGVRVLFLIIATWLIAIALMRPYGAAREQDVVREGRDVLIALDVSRSMLAQDVSPDRLGWAREKIKNIVKALDADRVGLLIFAGEAVMLCPLTHDHTTFSLFLKDVDAQMMTATSTALDRALIKAADLFERGGLQGARICVVVTDGEDFSEQMDVAHAKARDAGIYTLLLGVGTAEGAPIPDLQPNGTQKGHIKDAQGAVVISHLDMPALEKSARALGGIAIAPTDDDQDVAAIVAHVNKCEKQRFAQQKQVHREEVTSWIALAAFVTLLVEWII